MTAPVWGLEFGASPLHTAAAAPAVTKRQARRDSSCARAVSKWARVTSSPVASVLASRATSTTARASGSLASASSPPRACRRPMPAE